MIMDEDLLEMYKEAWQVTRCSQAAAILVLCDQIGQFRSTIVDIDQQICLGIRTGLFGAHANQNQDIRDMTVLKVEP